MSDEKETVCEVCDGDNTITVYSETGEFELDCPECQNNDQDTIDRINSELAEAWKIGKEIAEAHYETNKQFIAERADNERLQDIVDALPTTKDGVRFIPNTAQKLWWVDHKGKPWFTFDCELMVAGYWYCDGAERKVDECYSSSESALEAAKESENK